MHCMQHIMQADFDYFLCIFTYSNDFCMILLDFSRLERHFLRMIVNLYN